MYALEVDGEEVEGPLHEEGGVEGEDEAEEAVAGGEEVGRYAWMGTVFLREGFVDVEEDPANDADD